MSARSGHTQSDSQETSGHCHDRRGTWVQRTVPGASHCSGGRQPGKPARQTGTSPDGHLGHQTQTHRHIQTDGHTCKGRHADRKTVTHCTALARTSTRLSVEKDSGFGSVGAGLPAAAADAASACTNTGVGSEARGSASREEVTLCTETPTRAPAPAYYNT